MIAGTVGPFLPRMLLDTALDAGADRRQFGELASLGALGDDEIRVPTRQYLRLWELALPTLGGVGGCLRVVEQEHFGSLGVLDYLTTSATTLTDALTVAASYGQLVSDTDDTLDVKDDDTGLTAIFTWSRQTELAEEIDALSVAQILRQAHVVTGREVIPTRIQVPGQARDRYRDLVTAFGTSDITFEAPRISVTFGPADAAAMLPRADPTLAMILADYAGRLLATARPVESWLDTFRAELIRLWTDGPPLLPGAAGRLGVSPRTLQRRLRDMGTCWTEQLEIVRQEQVDRLLRTTPMSVESIATRVGYGDVRTLRRAVRRWYGASPSEIRRASN